MSHEIRWADYPLNVDKQHVQSQWNHVAQCEDYQEGCSGISNIRWNEHVCNTREDAEYWINVHDKGWYDCLACMYKVPKEVKPTESLLSMRKLLEKYAQRYHELNTQLFCEGFKSALYTCKGCNSKLAVKFLKRNICPVCGSDLRSDTLLKQIASARERVTNQQKAVADEEKRLRDKQTKANEKAEIRWLVKIEYHT